MSSLIESKQAWEQGPLARTLEKSPEHKPEFTTSSGIPLDRIYVPEEAPVDERQLGFPGEYPFTRGVPAHAGTAVRHVAGHHRAQAAVVAKRPSRELCLRQRTCPVVVIASD